MPDFINSSSSLCARLPTFQTSTLEYEGHHPLLGAPYNDHSLGQKHDNNIKPGFFHVSSSPKRNIMKYGLANKNGPKTCKNTNILPAKTQTLWTYFESSKIFGPEPLGIQLATGSFKEFRGASGMTRCTHWEGWFQPLRFVKETTAWRDIFKCVCK